MMKAFAFLLAIFALSEAAVHDRYFRVPENEVMVETKWMDRTLPTNSGRIVNGQPADISEFPYMLAMIDLVVGGFRCGSSAISSHWVLSAAHCTDRGTPPSMLNLRGGSTNRASGGIIFFVQSYWNHPMYGNSANIRSLMYDIVILQTQSDSPIQGTNVGHVLLPPVCNTDPCCGICGGVSTIVSGWGRVQEGDQQVSSPTLNQLTAPVHDFDDCNRIWGRMHPVFWCKAVVNNADTCSGDSGSPLVTGTGANRVQHGVVSFGTSVCGAGAPSVNIRVEYPGVRNWIRDHSGL